MRKFSTFLIGIFVLLITLGIVNYNSSPSYALFDNAKQQACGGIALSENATTCADKASGVDSIISTGLNIFSIIVGVVAVIMIIVAGVKFISSSGAADKVASARGTILYAVIGLIVAVFAQVIVKFVLNRAISSSKCPTGKTQIVKAGDCTP